MRKFGEFILRGRLQAAAMALIFGFIPLLGWVSVVILALVTLRKGALEGALVLIWAVIPDIVWAAMGNHMVLVYGIVCGSFFVWLMACVLRYTVSWGMVLKATAIFGIIGVIAVHLFVDDISAYWVAQYHSYYQELVKAANESGALTANDQARMNAFASAMQQQGVVQFMANVSTGVIGAFLLVGSLFNLFLGRWWQAVLFNPEGLRSELYTIRMNYIAACVLLVSTFVAYLGWKWLYDLVPLMLVPFFAAGISLVHNIVSKSKMWLFLLIVFYGGLIILSPYSLGVLLVAALVDSFFDLRRRYGVIPRGV